MSTAVLFIGWDRPVAGVDPLADLPNAGVVTADNVNDFLTLAEWPG